ncbi:MAG TPA: hypothetical protein VIG29_07915 [Vicinamibacteria bacterium]
MGKQVSSYLDFQKTFLAAAAAVGFARLALSLAGFSNATVAWLSMSVVALAATFYYGVAVHTKGFGSYKQLLPLVFFQVALTHAIAVLGILVSIAGFPNIYAAPEFSGPVPNPNQWHHVLAHLTIGIVVPTLLLWGIASLTLLITKKVARRPAMA